MTRCNCQGRSASQQLRTAGKAEDVRVGHGRALQQAAIRADLQTSRMPDVGLQQPILSVGQACV